MITESQLRAMFPNAGSRLDAHLPFIGPAMEAGKIDTPRRIAAFLAQLAHESGEYRYMQEIASGEAYEGRRDLGNTEPGDGVRFKGHGPIQITGRDNHRRCGWALGLDLMREPTLICTPEHGTRSAVWFWNEKGLSPLADLDWFLTISRIVNGGFNGLEDRLSYWHRNRQILGLPEIDHSNELDLIEDFQRKHGLHADGLVGPKTLNAVRMEAA